MKGTLLTIQGIILYFFRDSAKFVYLKKKNEKIKLLTHLAFR